MSKKCKQVDWAKVANALTKPKRLHLEKDESDGLFHCPIQACDHDGFGTQRGCRKHVTRKHRWFFYFDQKPSNAEIEASQVNDCNESPKNPSPPARANRFQPLNHRVQSLKNSFLGSPGVAGARAIAKLRKLSAKALSFSDFVVKTKTN